MNLGKAEVHTFLNHTIDQDILDNINRKGGCITKSVTTEQLTPSEIKMEISIFNNIKEN